MGIKMSRTLLVIIATSLMASPPVHSSNEDSAIHDKWAPNRRPASYTSETSKHLNLAYNSFYHRQDLAGCLHLGHAAEALKHGSELKADQVQSIDELLKQARHFCNEDKVSRRQATEHVRNAIRVLHDRDIRPAAATPAPVADDRARNPAQEQAADIADQ